MLVNRNKKLFISPIESKSLLTLSEAQALSGRSLQTLRDAILEGKLRAKMIGEDWKIKGSDLQEYIFTSSR
ncbi:hypothetical protein NUACC21_78890 [Scytonema sp. NUACC21]